ncbi:MAG: carboxypeptidase regulatory-like domain-containing protein [Lewinellaceae bacterium]|nr:carboxypeptidase regulatory-like domain-containing protein [Lewinellaceae bacterium]
MNITLRAVWFAAAWLFVIAGLSAQTSVQENLSRADKQYDLYAYNLALRTYEQVIKEQPNNARALARTGDCHFQLNRPLEALTWYERALLLNDAPPETMLSYGKALLQTGDYIGAKKWFLAYAEGNATVGQHYAQMCDFALQAGRQESLFQALNEPINTSASDYAPAFYGNKLAYSSARTDIKRKTTAKTSSDWTGSAYNQLFVTQRNAADNYLQNPAFLRDDLQNNFNEGPVSFSADGRRVAFCRNNFIDGTRQIAEKGVSMSLYIADIVDGKWANERAFPFNGSDFAVGFPCFSADGNTLYFASNQPGGFGGWDIFVTNWNAGSWSVPRNLGAPLNTPGNEVTPFFDGNNLYFASDWHKGLGGLDVFRAEMLDNSVRDVVHLGTGINSSRDDYGFVFDPKSSIGYLTSNRSDGRGNEDIWQIRKKVDEFVIMVTDPQRNPIGDVEIDFAACNSGIKQTDAGGRYAFAVATGKADCRVTVRKDGYRATTLPIQSSGEKNLTAVLVPEYGVAATQPTAAAPQTYSTTDIPVQAGTIEKFSVYVSDEQGRALPAAELNLTTCGLGTIYTDIAGKASFYYPIGALCNLVIRKNGLEDVVVPIHAQSTREMSVAMSADKRTKFSGIVLDANTRQTVQNVVVTARSRQGGHETLASSNASGQYALLLRPYQTYDISYGKDGYLNFASSVQTERATQADMELSPIAIQPMYGASPAPATYSTTTAPTSGGMISLAELGQTSTAPQPVAPAPAAAPKKINGYGIQLAANPEDFSGSQLRRYDVHSEHGNLYTVREGSHYKLRLGVYATKEQANAVLSKVTPVTRDAFVVRETQADESLLVPETADVSLAAKSPAMYAAQTSPLRYTLQVASWPMSRPVLLGDYANLNSIGTTYIQPENDQMRVRVGAWESYTQAEVARNEAVRLGYRDAVIVTEKAENLPAERQSGATAPKSVFTPMAATTTPAQYSTTSSAIPTATPVATNAKYYIRVCALEDTSNFDAKKIDGTGGVIEKWPVGDTKMTAVMLTGFSSVEQAITATDKLRAKGFADAYIIQDENGRMSRYRH